MVWFKQPEIIILFYTFSNLVLSTKLRFTVSTLSAKKETEITADRLKLVFRNTYPVTP